MKVYVVNKFWDYEGEMTDSVFSTLEKAELYIEGKNKAGKVYCDEMKIYEFETDEFEGEENE